MKDALNCHSVILPANQFRDALPWVFRVSGLEVKDASALRSVDVLQHTYVEAGGALPWIFRVNGLEVKGASGIGLQVRGFLQHS